MFYKEMRQQLWATPQASSSAPPHLQSPSLAKLRLLNDRQSTGAKHDSAHLKPSLLGKALVMCRGSITCVHCSTVCNSPTPQIKPLASSNLTLTEKTAGFPGDHSVASGDHALTTEHHNMSRLLSICTVWSH